MAATNPSEPAYQDYAVQRLSTYLKTDVCAKSSGLLEKILRRNCPGLVDSGRPAIQKIITQGTQRQNFIFFSIYQTDLAISPLVPSYHFATVGVLQNFYTYSAEKR